MAYPPGAPKPGGQKGQGLALALIRVCIGVYLLFMGIDKAEWLLDSTPLATQLSEWLVQATPASRWYLERMTPGIPLFARLVPLAEMFGGLALVAGFWTRLVATLAFIMVLNFQLAAAAMFSFSYLTDARGLPVLGALLALVIGGGRLPMSLRK